jgi:hypothetical protein
MRSRGGVDEGFDVVGAELVVVVERCYPLAAEQGHAGIRGPYAGHEPKPAGITRVPRSERQVVVAHPRVPQGAKALRRLR